MELHIPKSINPKKKDELMEMIPKLESNYHNLLSKIQCIDQQIKTSRSLNTELRMKNIQLATEFNSLDLPYDELLTVKQTNGIESEIKEHKNKIEIAGPGDNTPPQEDHS